MSTRIVTLFGEEIVPGPQKPVPKTRGKKGKENAAEEPVAEPEQSETVAPVQDAAPQSELVVVEEQVVHASVEGAAVQNEPVVAQEPVAETPVEVEEITPAEEEAITEVPPTTDTTSSHVSALSLAELGVSFEYMAEAILQKEYAAAEEAEQNKTANSIEPVAEMAAEAPETPAEEPLATVEELSTTEAPIVAEEAANIIPEDWKGDKNYYGIGEVAGFFSVKTSHIRFWTNEFKLKVRTTRKGDRLYTPDQVRELRAIYHLVKERGFTLSGAKTRLKEQNKRDVTAIPLKDQLLALRSKLQILRDQL